MFRRSLSEYQTKYISYIGDGDAKVDKYLIDNPTYSGVTIKKLRDTNHLMKAIQKCKIDVNRLYQRSWTIFNHHYSTNEKPMHEWCDSQWCKYLHTTIFYCVFDAGDNCKTKQLIQLLFIILINEIMCTTQQNGWFYKI